MTGAHLVLFDGVCGLCNGLVQFLLARDRHGVLTFASLQSATGQAVVAAAGGNPHELTSLYVVADHGTPRARVLRRSAGVLFIASALGWPWNVGGVLRMVPLPLLDLAYDFVARHRYQVFGTREQCMLPSPEFRQRFVE